MSKLLAEQVKGELVEELGINKRNAVFYNKLVEIAERQRVLTLELLKLVGKEGIAKEIQVIDKEIILSITQEFFGVTREDIHGKSRKTQIVLAKHAVRYLLSRYGRMSTPKIASITGLANNDHSTVLRSIKSIPSLRKSVYSFDECLKQCINKIVPLTIT